MQKQEASMFRSVHSSHIWNGSMGENTVQLIEKLFILSPVRYKFSEVYDEEPTISVWQGLSIHTPPEEAWVPYTFYIREIIGLPLSSCSDVHFRIQVISHRSFYFESGKSIFTNMWHAHGLANRSMRYCQEDKFTSRLPLVASPVDVGRVKRDDQPFSSARFPRIWKSRKCTRYPYRGQRWNDFRKAESPLLAVLKH